jgi:starch synthase
VHAHGWFAAAALPLVAQGLPQAARVLSLHDMRQQGRLSELRDGLVVPDAVRELAGTGADGSLLCAGALAAQRAVTSSQAEVHGLVDDPRLQPRLRQALSALAAEGKLVGIPNGLDAARWNPLTDPFVPSRFDPVSPRGKARCKDALQLELDLPIRPQAALVAWVAGSNEPSAGMLAAIAPSLLRNDVQLLVIGGEASTQEELRALAAASPERLRLLPAADERTQHRVIAAADFLLVLAHDPALGDLHLCAQRYGALPIVNKSSVMADTVVDCDAELTTGSGFAFEASDERELLAVLQRALAAFAKGPAFDALRRRVMQLDVSWERSARRYEYLYNAIRSVP